MLTLIKKQRISRESTQRIKIKGDRIEHSSTERRIRKISSTLNVAVINSETKNAVSSTIKLISRIQSDRSSEWGSGDVKNNVWTILRREKN